MKQHKNNLHLYLAGIVLLFSALAYYSGTDVSLTGMQVAQAPLYAAPQPPSLPQVPQLVSSSQTTPLDGAVQFLKDFGFFNVVLPFLLIFAIVFGILEKTKIFGTEKVKNEDIPRRNLNSIVSFCIAFFVVAASNVVGIIQASIPAVALVLLIVIVFLLLFGSLMSTEKLTHGIGLWGQPHGRILVVAIFIAMIAIFLGAFGALPALVQYVTTNMSGTVMASIFLLVFVVGAVWFATHTPKSTGGSS